MTSLVLNNTKILKNGFRILDFNYNELEVINDNYIQSKDLIVSFGALTNDIKNKHMIMQLYSKHSQKSKYKNETNQNSYSGDILCGEVATV